jgi:SdrD B-like domain
MSKRNPVSVTVLSAFALATLCLLSAVITAQKGLNTVSGAPLGGIDIKLGRNPGGNAAARTETTDEKGQLTFVGLTPGNYSVTIVGPSQQQQAANRGAVAADNYEVEIVGAVGGTITRDWNVKERKFATSNATARATTAPRYEDTINFEIGGGPPTPKCTIIVKSKSNISNNRVAAPSPTPRRY